MIFNVKADPIKLSRRLKIEQEIALLFKMEYLKYFNAIKISLWYTI